MGQAVSKPANISKQTNKQTNKQVIVFALMVMLFFTYCKEEPVQPKEVTSTAEISAAKKASEAQLALQLDNDKTIDKEKFEKLKAEHEKPYAVKEKPIEVLKKYLKDRKAGKLGGTSKSVNQKSVMQTLCNPVYVEIWGFEKYLPIANKFVGIDPKIIWQTDVGTLQALRNTYGFRRVFVAETRVGSPKAAGFTSAEIGVVISEIALFDDIMNIHDTTEFKNCFINEPTIKSSINYTQQMLNTYANQWKSKFPGSLMLGERTYELAQEFDQYVDVVNSTIYRHYEYSLPYSVCQICYEAYWPLSADQRTKWTDWNNTFGAKFNGLWISGPSDDLQEMDLLAGHAQNMGKNMISLFFDGDDSNGYSNTTCWNWVWEFTARAWQHGYLQRELRKYVYEYVYCWSGDPCTDDDETHWALINITPTQITQID